jgi:CxxC motif-containing protein (DUF1111 family)
MRLALLLCLIAAPALGQSLDDRQLAVAPRAPNDAAKIAAVLAPPSDFTRPEPFENLSAGAATLQAAPSRDSFSAPSANMDGARGLEFQLGKALFDKLWVAAPASTRASDGLGPLYNARACQDCHFRDGRGRLPATPDARTPGLVLRFSLPDLVYGVQLQDQAAPGQKAEGKVVIAYQERSATVADGTVVPLRRPVYLIGDPAYDGSQPHSEGWPRLSPRLAPPMIGLGLLEAIPSANILARADADDRDGDGISGRATVVMSAEYGVPMLGRFGWKAAVATVREQVATALSIDMGLSSPLFPDPWGDCTAAQAVCRDAPDGQEPGIRDGRELDGASLDLITLYAGNLAVPARRGADDPTVLRGKALFYQADCTACHVPKYVTARLADRPEQSFQLIWPYTDLLLHDMGVGLADAGQGTAHEWRTPPLWGIGLTEQVGGQAAYLHDGRARSLLEAILWHDGEGAASRDRVKALPKDDRDALIAFLESL